MRTGRRRWATTSPRGISIGVSTAAISALALALACLPANAGALTTPPVEALSNGPYGFLWSPKEVRTEMGVTFVNKTPGVPHGILWTSTPKEPTCAGTVPTGAGKSLSTAWSGECTFSQPGVYNYECSYHLSAMTGTVVVPGTPKAATLAASPAPTQTEATLNGEIDPEGEAIEYRFEYGISGVSEKQTQLTGLTAGDFAGHPVSQFVTGLLPTSEYHFRLVIVYGASKTIFESEKTFTTPPAAKPTAETTAVGGLREREATLTGKVDPEGGGKTEYFFEWGPGSSGSYEHATAPVSLPSDGAVHSISSQPPLSGLEPGAAYHYRLVAKNELGTTNGEEATFTTLSPPSKEPPTSPPPTSPPPTIPAPTGSPAPSPLPLSFGPEEALAPLVAGSLNLRAPARGSSVKVSIDVSPLGAGGRLEVDLLAARASVARRAHSKQVVVGRLVRGSVLAGNVSFSVALNARGKRALRRHHRLGVTVKIVLTPPGGQVTALARKVVMRY